MERIYIDLCKGEIMKALTQLKLNNYTEMIHEAEKNIVYSFIDIGQQLKEVRDNKIYKESYDTFEDYIEENFSFSKRNADNMIRVSGEFGKTSSQKLGVSKLLLLLQLPEENRQELIDSGIAEDSSVRELKDVVEDKLDDLADNEVENLINSDEVVVSSPVEGVSDKVDMLGRALSYLSEELDNVFSGLNNIDKSDFKKEYSKNKEFYKHNFSKIEEKFDEVTEKLRKAKNILHKLKTMRRG